MFGKIHDCIFGSSIMEEDVVIRYVWMCMITIADQNGIVDETIPALARRFNLNVNEMIKSIDALERTDISSRNMEHEGRRIERIRETYGWRILNYNYYRNLQSAQDRKEYMKNYMRVKRSKQSVNKCKQPVSTLADTDTDTDTDKELLSKQQKSFDPSTYKKFIEIYHSSATSLLPLLKLTEPRKKLIRTRWKEHHDTDFWKAFWTEMVEGSDFLTGRQNGNNEKHINWKPNMDWCLKESNFIKIVEGNYVNR